MNEEGVHREPPAPPAEEEGEAEGVDPIIRFVSSPPHCAVMGADPLTTFIQVVRRLHHTMVSTQDTVRFLVDRELRSLRENQDSLEEHIRQIYDALEEDIRRIHGAHEESIRRIHEAGDEAFRNRSLQDSLRRNRDSLEESLRQVRGGQEEALLRSFSQLAQANFQSTRQAVADLMEVQEPIVAVLENVVDQRLQRLAD